MHRIIALSAVAGLASADSASLSLSLYTLPEGESIIQVTGSIATNTGGGLATDETRTAYVLEPDFGDPEPNFTDYTGTAWPNVYVSSTTVVADLNIDAAITADVQLLTNPSSGAGLQWVLINGNPLYQFINDNAPGDANGNFGPWFWLTADGTPTQNPVPAPGAAALLGLAGAAAARRRL